eukprot:gnl/MRDRNA2_/MRDRNA2_28180_c0_seq1.p1 gnl/MRDRNA2_/MRDRNA2_28180_c0~~gnl/MRDRNA2_/MRDRNA2_28180_c0_seq1.p1  ORF type:complete len:751 (+),score=116.43 gnl/MRDRNA2_/MRDRNA2_28180_c0_seq1:182-2254(+)
MDPPSRNLVAANNNNEQCPHCVNAGGTTAVKARAKGHHPSREREGTHGICGDPVQNHPWPASPAQAEYMVPTKAYRTYTEGQIITIAIGISTHHTGHFDFRICDEEGGVNGKTGVGSQSQLAAQKCFDKWVLERVDPKERPECNGKDWTTGDNDCQPIDPSAPERWYQGPRGNGEIKNGHPYLSKFQEETGLNGWYHAGEGHLMHYRLPKGLTCNKCTLQWHWQTANSCLPDQSYKTYPFPSSGWCGWCKAGWATIPVAGCGNGGRYGEEFWNCADISIKAGSGGGSPRPAPRPMPALPRRRRSGIPHPDAAKGRRRAPIPPPSRRRRSAPAPMPVLRRRRSAPAPRPVLRRRRSRVVSGRRRRRRLGMKLKDWRRRRRRFDFGRRRRRSKRSLLTYGANVSQHHTKSEVAAWAQTPLEWSFTILVTKWGSEHSAGELAHARQSIFKALEEWMGVTDERLHIDGEPFSAQNGAETTWVFPFRVIVENPEDHLQDMRVDAISLSCIQHDVGLCHDGPVNFQPMLEKHCITNVLQEFGVQRDACDELPTMSLAVNLTVMKRLRFEVSFLPLPQRLIDDVGRFMQVDMEDWADRIGPKLRTPVAETANVAEDLVKISGARILPNSGEAADTDSELALVVDMSVGLLTPQISAPVMDSILQELPKDHEWVLDIMGLAAEEKEIGDIGLIVNVVK